ncbi:E3 ubiquitin-protein ligase RNF103 [Melanotaenia boesemani]|uniref:E3 ubiquitin-protein ligase RNF103 n=1 Tax=Melanotaenia boesemani TaxID=1250792 RepID=UPI001C05051D|nr:E3 ubiquitin-protein ligase RNF103 [Melanotaenia boesemani]
MWLKLFFLFLYFIVLFVLARIFEAVVWYETGMFATQLVDPVTLSYNKLKTILECRGLGYAGLAEKKDVSELVEKSGELTQGELYSAIKKEKEAGDSTLFSGEMHFYELVEDTKDGIWLVQVIAQDREALLSQSNWEKMVQKVSQFGIRTGTFNCSSDHRNGRTGAVKDPGGQGREGGQDFLFHAQGATVKRFVVLIRTLGTYNSILLVSWLPVLALLQLPYLETLYSCSLKLLRYADTTTLASLVRADWTFYSSHPALFLSTYLAHGLLVDYVEKKRRCRVRNQEDSTTNLEWLASLWDWYTSYLLHPIASLQPFPSDQSDWEDDSNVFFERLAFPDLWLRPLVNMDYIKALPTWRLRDLGQQREGDEKDMKDGDIPGSSRLIDPVSGQDTDGSIHADPGSDRSSPSSEEGSPTPGGVPPPPACDWSEWPADMLLCSECVVCLENFVSEELLMGLPCSHAFHQPCIAVWLAAGRHCCPVCRWPSYKKKRQRGCWESLD